MNINCNQRILICIFLLIRVAFISKITSEPLRIHRRPSEGSLKLSPGVNAINSWSQRLGKILMPFNRRKLRKPSVEKILPPLESSIVPSSPENDLNILPPKLLSSLLVVCRVDSRLRATFGKVKWVSIQN